MRSSKTLSFGVFCRSCKGVFGVLGSVLEMIADVDILISRLQDCKIKIAGLQDHLRAIFQKVEFRVLFGVLVKVFSEFWVRFWR